MQGQGKTLRGLHIKMPGNHCLVLDGTCNDMTITGAKFEGMYLDTLQLALATSSNAWCGVCGPSRSDPEHMHARQMSYLHLPFGTLSYGDKRSWAAE